MFELLGYKIPKSLFYLYLNRLIILVGVGFWGLFLPIFLFEKFNYSYQAVLLFFGVVFFVSIFLQPLGAMLLSRIGLRKSMIIGIIFLTGYYFSFFIYSYKPLLVFLICAILANNFWRIMYWVPFHTDLAKFSSNGQRGKQYSVLVMLSDLLGIVIPVFAGLILDYYSYPVMFILAIVIILSSIIPIHKIEKNIEKFDWSYFQTYQELFKKKNRKILYAYTADGAETIVGAIIWPIFIFQILHGEYLAVGAVSTLIIAVTVILDIVTGQFVDKLDKKKILGYGSVFYAIGWLIKVFVSSAFHIFIVSTYHNLTSIFRRIPFDALMYEKAADAGHYVDEFTVIREISLNFGRVLMLVFAGLLIYAFGIYTAFILAAIISLFINVIE